MRDPQPAPLTEEEIERLRQEHARSGPCGCPTPCSEWCRGCQEDVDWPCAVIRGLATLDQERTRRQAAETALAEERQAREAAEIDRDAYRDMWMNGKKAWELMDAQSDADRDAREQAMVAAGELATLLSQARAALAQCESRLAEARTALKFYANWESYRLWDKGASMRLARCITSNVREDCGQRAREALSAHPAPPSVEYVRDPMRLLYRLTLSGARRDWSAEHDSRCRLGDWDCVGDAPACPYPLPGWSVWKAWRDGMLAQGREVAPERMDWAALSAHDKALDADIEAAILLAVAHPAHGLAEGQGAPRVPSVPRGPLEERSAQHSSPPGVGAPPPVEEFIGHATPFRVWSQQDTDPPATPAARAEEGE